MKRETTNFIRFILEDTIPPAARDWGVFRWLFKLAYGAHIDALADFRKRAPFLTAEEYRALYEKHPRIQEDTDNSKACIERIAENATGPAILDVGCGTGYVLEILKKRENLKSASFTGVDFVLSAEQKARTDIKFIEANIEKLPFKDGEFDTVICTHVLEHILDIRQAIAELRRIYSQRLIIVVPREREYIYTFNPHFHFFPYPHSFLRAMIPVPAKHRIETIRRDYFYMEEK